MQTEFIVERNTALPDGALIVRPDDEIRALAAEIRDRGVTRALNLGIEDCGVGILAGLGLQVETVASPLPDLDYADGTFDYVLAWDTLDRGEPALVERAVSEISRVLKPGGLVHATMLTKRHFGFRRGHEIARDTWVELGESGDEPQVARFYCSAAGLALLFRDFELLRLTQLEDGVPGAWRWHFVAEKMAR